MDVSPIVNKINSIDNLPDLEAYQTKLLSQFTGGIGILEEQIVQIASLTNPATFIANMIANLVKVSATLEKQLSDTLNGLESINAAVANKKSELKK